MVEIDDLLAIADAYKKAAGIDRDSTVSYRVFRDTKKLAYLRAGGDITVGRFNAALCWFAENWPAGADRHPLLPVRSTKADLTVIRDMRVARGMSQIDLASYLGVDRSTVSRIENGSSPRGAVRRLLEMWIADQAGMAGKAAQ